MTSSVTSSSQTLEHSLSKQSQMLFEMTPAKKLVLQQAEAEMLDKLKKNVLQDNQTLQLYEQQRLNFLSQRQKESLAKQQDLRLNYQVIQHQIQERKQREKLSKEVRASIEKDIIQRNNNELVNIYPPIREMPREAKRFREQMGQKELLNQLGQQVSYRSDLEQLRHREIKESERVKSLQKYHEALNELDKLKLKEWNLNQTWVKDWDLALKLKNPGCLEGIEEESVREQQSIH